MSHGLEVYTGNRRARYATDTDAAIPSKILLFKEYPTFRESDTGTYYFTLDRPYTQVKEVFLTYENNVYKGYKIEDDFGVLPYVYAKVDESKSSGNTIAVDLIVGNGNWLSSSQQYISLCLWLLGE